MGVPKKVTSLVTFAGISAAKEVSGMSQQVFDVSVRMLGEFCLEVDGQALSDKNSRSTKLTSVLCYLLLHRDRPVTQTELIETFWEDESQGNPLSALKMLILRIRNALKPLFGEAVNPIVSHRGAYRWNEEIPCRVDAEDFEEYCHAAERAAAMEEKLALYTKAADIYRGDFLPERANLTWVIPLNTRLHMRYVSMVKKYAALLEKAELFGEMEAVSQQALSTDHTDESLNVLLIRSMILQKKQAAALAQYKRTVDMLYRDLGVRPSEELQALYPLVTNEEKNWEQDIDSIMDSMRGELSPKEAFFCGFDLFKNIYQLESRRAKRTGSCLHVALMTVTGPGGAALSESVREKVMGQVQNIVAATLRQSDVVTRYSKCQYMVMLPGANLENSELVMTRIVRAYQNRHPRSLVQISYVLRELELA